MLKIQNVETILVKNVVSSLCPGGDHPIRNQATTK
jgi:hypothetical protein